jgi:hypothetical protein
MLQFLVMDLSYLNYSSASYPLLFRMMKQRVRYFPSFKAGICATLTKDESGPPESGSRWGAFALINRIQLLSWMPLK